jgi:hypothetical protein
MTTAMTDLQATAEAGYGKVGLHLWENGLGFNQF